MPSYSEIRPKLSSMAQGMIGEGQLCAKGCNAIDSAHVLLAALDVNMSTPPGSGVTYPAIYALLNNSDLVARLRERLKRRQPPTHASAPVPDELTPDLSESLERAIHMHSGIPTTPAAVILAILTSPRADAGYDFKVFAEALGIDPQMLQNELKVLSDAQAGGSSAIWPVRLVEAISPYRFADRHRQMMSSLTIALTRKLNRDTSGVILVWGMPGTTTKVLTRMLADGIAVKTSALATALPSLHGVTEQNVASLVQLKRERAVQQLSSAIQSAADDQTILVLRHIEYLRPGAHVQDDDLRKELLALLLDVRSELVIAHYQTTANEDPRVSDLLGLEPAATVPAHPMAKQYTFLTIRDYCLSDWEKPGGVYFADIARPLGEQKPASQKSDGDGDSPDVKRMDPAFGLLFDLSSGIWYGPRHMATPYAIIDVVGDCVLRAKQNVMLSAAQSAQTYVSESLSQLLPGKMSDQYKAPLMKAEQLIKEVVKEQGALQKDEQNRTILLAKHLIVELFSRVGSASFQLPTSNSDPGGDTTPPASPPSGNGGGAGKVGPIRLPK